jgi:hypothetical protein
MKKLRLMAGHQEVNFYPPVPSPVWTVDVCTLFFQHLFILDAWLKILEPVESQRKDTNRVNLFPGYITGEVRNSSCRFTSAGSG